MDRACSIEIVLQMSFRSLALNRERNELYSNVCRIIIEKVELPVSCSIVLVEVVESFIRTQGV